MQLIAPLACALVEADADISLTPGSQIAEIYQETTITEQYRCSYGLNKTYLNLFENSQLTISGFDAEGDPRVFELKEHPFFFGTAYQPERSALKGVSHPLVIAYIQAIIHQQRAATSMSTPQ